MKQVGLLVLGVVLAGCAVDLRRGPVVQPAIYPDRSTADGAWETFLWAWRQGDVDVLQEVSGWRMRERRGRRADAWGDDRSSIRATAGQVRERGDCRRARRLHAGSATHAGRPHTGL